MLRFTRSTLLLLVATSSCHAQPSILRTSDAWSSPLELPGMPPDQLHRSPSVTSVGDTVYVAANLYPRDGMVASARPIYLARHPGGVMAAPAGDFQFVFPRIIADSRGAVHLLWTEFARREPSLMNWGTGAKTTLWHSVYNAGLWSSPQQILTGDWLEWPRSGGNIFADSAGALHIVLLTVRASVTRTTHLIWRGGNWQDRTLPFQRPDLAVYARQHALYIGIVRSSHSVDDTSGISLAVIDEGDLSGIRPFVVHRLVGRVASQLQFIAGDDALYLAWSEAPNGGNADTLRVIRLDSAGRRIATTAAVSLPRGAAAAELAWACRGIAVLTETFSGTPQTHVGLIRSSGEVVLEQLLPRHELTAFAGLGPLPNRLSVIAATRRDSLTRPQAVLLSRPCF